MSDNGALNQELLGVVTRGSLVEGIEMKLDPAQNVEDVKAGKFVVIRGQKHEFFSMITDVRLDANNADILINPPGNDDELLQEVLKGSSTYATISLRPMLMLSRQEFLTGDESAKPVKTIPPHFANVYDAAERDVYRIFGDEAVSDRFFNIGRPLDMETPVCLNLDRFVERSNGIFGKTGTGKTFLARLVLSGLIKNQKAVNFIFDMHSEYGWGSRKEGRGNNFVKGLKEIFPSRVALFSLDPESTRRRGVQPDHEVYISYDQIWVEDIAPLQDELRLNPTAIEAAYLLVARYRSNWLKVLLHEGEVDIKAFSESLGAHPESLSALYRKLKRLEHFPFLTPNRTSVDVIDKIMQYLNRGIHVVLEFGQQTSMLCYLLVSNIITRRIHREYVSKTERYQATHDPADMPRQLVITIEEAHKFLNPAAARQTIFGTIAREMRKYYASLLIVDQRPSGIDEEVLSQLGTKIVAQLNDEKDIQAVLTGMNNASGLRSVLASLDSKQQALILGHAVPMPVVIRTRDYGEQFYRDMGDVSDKAKKEQVQREQIALFGK